MANDTQKVARVGDPDQTHCSGPVRAMGSSNVFCNGIPVSRQGDKNSIHLKPPHNPCKPHTAGIAVGSSTVFVNSKGIGRKNDEVSDCTSVADGSSNVFAG